MVDVFYCRPLTGCRENAHVQKVLFIIIRPKKYSSRDTIPLNQWWHISINLMRSRIRIRIDTTVKVKSGSATLVVLSRMCIGTFVENLYFSLVSANVQQISELEKKSARDLMEGGQLRWAWNMKQTYCNNVSVVGIAEQNSLQPVLQIRECLSWTLIFIYPGPRIRIQQ